MAEYERGFFGGKFLPFHKGHKYCIERGAAECEDFVVIFFMHSEDEAVALRKEIVCDRALLSEKERIRRIKEECRRYPNVRFVTLDCSVMHEKALRDGTDLWVSIRNVPVDTRGEVSERNRNGAVRIRTGRFRRILSFCRRKD